MKVDIQRMDEAYIQLMNLQRQLMEVENSIQAVKRNLAESRIGGGAATTAVLASLAVQLKAVEQRVEGVGQLAQVLQSAADQYRQCESEAQRRSESSSIYQIYPGALEMLRKINIVNPKREQQIIDQYIMPFIVTGKKETT